MRVLWSMIVALLVSLGLMGCATVNPLTVAQDHCTIIYRIVDGAIVANSCPVSVPSPAP